MLRVVCGGVLAGVVLFACGFISWGVLPWHELALQHTDAEREFVDAARQYLPQDGWYSIPQISMRRLYSEPDENERTQMMEQWLTHHKAGPIIHIFYRRQGADPMSMTMYAMGLGAAVLSGLCAAGIVACWPPPRPRYWRRVAAVILAGGMAVFMIDLPYWIYMYSPTDYVILICLDHVVGAFLVALVTAAVVR